MNWFPWIGRSATAAVVILSAVAALSDEPQPPTASWSAPLGAPLREKTVFMAVTAGTPAHTENSFGLRFQIRRQPGPAPLMRAGAAIQSAGNQWIILEPLFGPPDTDVGTGRLPPAEEAAGETDALRQYVVGMVFMPVGPLALKAGLALDLADAGSYGKGEGSALESPRIGASIGFGYHIKDTLSLEMDYVYILADGFSDGPGTLSGHAVGAGENASTVADQFLGAILHIQF